MTEIATSQLRTLLEYEPSTGSVRWRARPVEMFSSRNAWSVWTTRYVGKEAGSYGKQGYGRISIAGKMFLAHRVAFAIHHGRWPYGQIDHINGDRADNRICNLREVGPVENARNQKRHKRNTSGAAGVSWHKASQKWQAHIGQDGRMKYLGLYDSYGEALAARRAAEIALGFSDRAKG